MAETPNQQLVDLWRKQLEDGTQAWLKMMGQGQAADPQAFWRPFLDPTMAAWSKVLGQGTASPDLLTQWKQFVDQWIAAWSKALEQAMSTEAFARALGKQLEGFLNTGGPARKAAEQQMEAGLSAVGIASRAQVVGLARQLVQLEEKLEGLEDRLDTILKSVQDLRPTPKGERS